MTYKTIGVKQLYRQLTQISEDALAGQSFVVIKNTTPIFKIVPFEIVADKKYSLQDIAKLQFKSDDKNLSKNINQMLY